MRTKIIKRGFLNEAEGIAAYQSVIEPYNKEYTYACFDITDCNRKISLNFDFTKQEELEKALYKLNTLIDALTTFKETLTNPATFN